MLSKYFKTFDIVKSVALISGIVVIYRGYDDLKEMVNKGLDTTSEWQISFWKSIQGEGVEPVDFKTSFLDRDFFFADWKMKPEPRLIYENSYPAEMAIMLDAGGHLRPEYRSEI